MLSIIYTALLFALLASQASAIPSIPKFNPHHFNASFDSLKTNPLRGGNTSVKDVPCPYLGLCYPSFNASSNKLGPLKTHSPPNYAVTDTNIRAAQGLVQAQITAISSGSWMFDLKSMWFGCNVDSAGAGNLPVICTVSFSGQKALSSQTVLVTKTFIPPGADPITGISTQTSPFQFYSFEDSFMQMSYVNITVTKAGTAGAAAVAAFKMDNVIGTYYTD